MLRLLQQQQHHLHHRRPALAGLLPRALAAHGAEAPGPDRPSARYSAVPAPEPAPPAPGETDLSRTLCLPKTEYPMRADAARREPLLRHRATTGLYHQQLADPARQGRTFVLHDGPPYANGRIHMGHCLNRVLKDFVMRYRLLRGDRVVSIPGWDCHGLPIELKAQEAFSKRQKAASKKRKQADPPAGAPAPSSSPMDVRHLARDFALSTIREQRDVFERLGILADLSDEGLAAHTYQTLDPRFEAAQLTVFAKMVARGNIYRDYKPVYWSPASRTALAEAELEYADNYVSRSVLVKFPLEKCPHDSALLIWTTTPWTLPANMAVAVSPGLEYVLVRPPAGPEAQQPSQPVWVARARVGYLAGELGCAEEDLTVLASAPGTELVGRRYTAPYAGQCAAAGPGAPSAHLFTVVDATYVTDDSGTGLVHTAPAHGLDDYVRCRALGMNFDSFVDAAGCYNAKAPAALVGLPVIGAGSGSVIDDLTARGLLLRTSEHRHRYPFDWRAKKPVIMRATEQWFCRVSDLTSKALEQLQTVNMVPPSSRRRIESMLRDRADWCISRQRSWGVPIPAFFHKETGAVLMDEATVLHVRDVLLRNGGTDAWWTLPVGDLLPPGLAAEADLYEKGTDTMDVWFDSGTSWAHLLDRLEELGALPAEHPAALDVQGDFAPVQADVYLEGSDQHRGWFQSALLTSIASRGIAPYKTLITHGFINDDNGAKMSKSIGNVLEPDHFILGGKNLKSNPAYGTDVLRMWASSVEYTSDVSVGPVSIGRISETMRKLRNTSRFILGNLYDFEFGRDAVPYERLRETDKYVLHLLAQYVDDAASAYDRFQFNHVYQNTAHLLSASLSSLYFEAAKDRLYADAIPSLSRRSVQTVLFHILHSVTRVLAPITVHGSEELFDHYRRHVPNAPESVALLGWPELPAEWRLAEDAPLLRDFSQLAKLRLATNRALEQERRDRRIGSGLEARLTLDPAPGSELARILDTYRMELPQFFGVSVVEVGSPTCESPGTEITGEEADIEGLLRVRASPSPLSKCPRCWLHVVQEAGSVCCRCTGALASAAAAEAEAAAQQ